MAAINREQHLELLLAAQELQTAKERVEKHEIGLAYKVRQVLFSLLPFDQVDLYGIDIRSGEIMPRHPRLDSASKNEVSADLS